MNGFGGYLLGAGLILAGYTVGFILWEWKKQRDGERRRR